MSQDSTLATPRHRPAPTLDMADVYAFGTRVLTWLLAWTAAAVIGFPLLWMVLCSFKSSGELYAFPPTFLPHVWTLDNYVNLFSQTQFGTYFLNSLIVAFGATAVSLPVGAMGAYTLTRFDSRTTRALSRLTLVCYMLPEVLLVVPLYGYVVRIGLADTLVSLIIANAAFTLPLTLWFMRSYFRAVSVSMEESAMIDGCTRAGAVLRVTLPLALPGLASVSLFSFNHAWNEFLFALVFTSSEQNKVLSVGLATWIGQGDIRSWGMLLAAAVLITVPVVTFFLVVERKLVSGLSEGGAKGG